MESFDRRLLTYLVEVLEQPRCVSIRQRINEEVRRLMAEMPNAGLTVRSARIEVMARTDFFDLIVEVRQNGRLLAKSEWALAMLKSKMSEDYFVTWILT